MLRLGPGSQGKGDIWAILNEGGELAVQVSWRAFVPGVRNRQFTGRKWKQCLGFTGEERGFQQNQWSRNKSYQAWRPGLYGTGLISQLYKVLSLTFLICKMEIILVAVSQILMRTEFDNIYKVLRTLVQGTRRALSDVCYSIASPHST